MPRLSKKEQLTIVFAIFVIATLSVLRYFNSISESNYITILMVIVTAIIGVKKKHEIKPMNEKDRKLRDQIYRAGIVSLVAGIVLIVSKLIEYGEVITLPPLLDHGLYGLILTIVGTFILTKIGDKYLWEIN